jgi:hypothetical protein
MGYRVMPIDPAIATLATVALGVIFAASGAMKLADLELFEGAVANYRLLPHWMEKPFAMTLPVVECAAAAGLLIPATRAPAALASLALLAMFTGAVAINLARGRTNIDCGCFGPALRQELSAWMLPRNAMLAALGAAALMPAPARPLLWLDWVTIALGAAMVIVLYLSANYAIGNEPRTRALEAL